MGRLFRLTPQGTAHAIVEPSADFQPWDMELNLGLFPVLTGVYFRQPVPYQAYDQGPLMMQTVPPVPKGPLILGPPRATVRNGQRILSVETVGGRPPFQWQWYRNDRPILGP